MEFSSEKELYDRLRPALRTKLTELSEYGYGYLKIEDIWNYLKESKWKNGHNLSLNDMVSDILNADNELVDAYFKDKLNEKNRVVYFEN